jgi:hypothetical protein
LIASNLDAAAFAKSGRNAELRQNYELKQEPDEKETDYPVKFVHFY